MRSAASTLVGAGLAVILAACEPTGDTGYVEIRTVPASTAVSVPPLYLNAVKLEPPNKGVAVLRQRIGTVKLATDGHAGQSVALCDIVVKKNRVTTVTVSIVERPPRCRCQNSDAASNRTCVS